MVPGAIGDVGSRRNDPGSGAPSRADHLAGSAAHRAQAHLAQEIEIVLVKQDQLGLLPMQQTIVLIDPIGQHRIEERYPVPLLSQEGNYLQCGQRRIGFGAQYLLLIETQVIRVANQDRKHRRSISCGPRVIPWADFLATAPRAYISAVCRVCTGIPSLSLTSAGDSATFIFGTAIY